MKNWFASKTKVSLRRKHRRIGTKGGEVRREKGNGVHKEKSRKRTPTVILVSEEMLTYAVLGEVMSANAVRSVIDLRQNPRRYRPTKPRLTVDSHAGLVGFLTSLGSQYFWPEKMSQILGTGSQILCTAESMPSEEFGHVQDFLRLLVSRKSNVLLIVPEGTNELFFTWLAPQLDLICHFDPMSVLFEGK